MEVDAIVSNVEEAGEDEGVLVLEQKLQEEHEEKIKALREAQEEAQKRLEEELAQAKKKMEDEKQRLAEEEMMRLEDIAARKNEDMLSTERNAKTLETIKSGMRIQSILANHSLSSYGTLSLCNLAHLSFAGYSKLPSQI